MTTAERPCEIFFIVNCFMDDCLLCHRFSALPCHFRARRGTEIVIIQKVNLTIVSFKYEVKEQALTSPKGGAQKGPFNHEKFCARGRKFCARDFFFKRASQL